jgi:hypothetical protein
MRWVWVVHRAKDAFSLGNLETKFTLTRAFNCHILLLERRNPFWAHE